jgi:hypothetical protein
MKFPRASSIAMALLAILPLALLNETAAARDLTTSLKTSSAAAAQAQSPITVRFIYSSPADISKQTAISVYLILFDLNKNATAAGSRVRNLLGPNARAPFVFVMRPNQIVAAVIRSPGTPFTSLDPSVVGNLSVQINGGSSTPVTLEEYDPNTVVGFFNRPVPVQPAGRG